MRSHHSGDQSRKRPFLATANIRNTDLPGDLPEVLLRIGEHQLNLRKAKNRADQPHHLFKLLRHDTYIYICISCIYIYISREREREGERESNI